MGICRHTATLSVTFFTGYYSDNSFNNERVYGTVLKLFSVLNSHRRVFVYNLQFINSHHYTFDNTE